MKLALAVIAVVALSAGCVRSASRTHHVHRGTCEGACAHYIDCKESGDEAAYQACVLDCPNVFVDAESLRAFEAMSCEATLDFVEGDSGRGPGEAARGAEPGGSSGDGGASSSPSP